ncbi:hypothetical protein LTR08_004610 [Meristemomyces frigidus]|nr:hypothetical protein LTR08_004610 [Meristemomyces frigidus]
MFTFFKAPAVTKTATPTGKVKLNSSKESAGLSRSHNQLMQELNRPHLLALPVNLRSRIFQLVVVNSTATTILSAEDPALCSEPELTRVCHDIRELALPMYHRENLFVVRVEQYDVQAVLPWLKRHALFLDTEEGGEVHVAIEPSKGFIQRSAETDDKPYRELLHNWLEDYATRRSSEGAPSTGQRGDVIVRTDGRANWANLQQWLKLAHAGEVMALEDDDYQGGEYDRAVKGAFTLAMGLSNYPWFTVRRALPGVKELLVAGDGRWAARDEMAQGDHCRRQRILFGEDVSIDMSDDDELEAAHTRGQSDSNQTDVTAAEALSSQYEDAVMEIDDSDDEELEAADLDEWDHRSLGSLTAFPDPNDELMEDGESEDEAETDEWHANARKLYRAPLMHSGRLGE